MRIATLRARLRAICHEDAVVRSDRSLIDRLIEPSEIGQRKYQKVPDVPIYVYTYKYTRELLYREMQIVRNVELDTIRYSHRYSCLSLFEIKARTITHTESKYAEDNRQNAYRKNFIRNERVTSLKCKIVYCENSLCLSGKEFLSF